MSKLSRYNSAISIAFSVDHDCDDPLDLPLSFLVAALLRRVNNLLLETPESAKEAFDAYDTCDNPLFNVSH